METTSATTALGALAQETRLAAFRLLVRSGPAGLPAGVIAERLGVPPATLSFHLKELERARLLIARRESRQIYYAADFEGMRELLAFLMDDCCQGDPQMCAPVVNLRALKTRGKSTGGNHEKVARTRQRRQSR